jgi:hypothetical protein
MDGTYDKPTLWLSNVEMSPKLPRALPDGFPTDKEMIAKLRAVGFSNARVSTALLYRGRHFARDIGAFLSGLPQVGGTPQKIARVLRRTNGRIEPRLNEAQSKMNYK